MLDISNFLSIEIPNLLNNPYVIQPVSLNNQLYFFEYRWNIRYGRAFLSVYTKENNTPKYFIKNVCLIPQMVLSDNIRDNDWSGALTFALKIDRDVVDYRQDTINVDFDIKYISEEE